MASTVDLLPALRETAGLRPVDEAAPLDTPPGPTKTNVAAALEAAMQEDREAWIAIRAARSRLESMQGFAEEIRDAVFPTRIRELRVRLDSEDQICSQLVKRAKELVAVLGGSDEEYKVPAVNTIRASLGQLAQAEFRALLKEYLGLRAARQADVARQSQRQLRYVFPDSTPEQIEMLMEHPDTVASSIAQRVEGISGKGASIAVPSLQDAIEETTAGTADLRRLEREALELKTMFSHFAELIDEQGELLDAIDTKIEKVVEETEVSVELIVHAKKARRQALRAPGLIFVVCLVLVVLLSGLFTMRFCKIISKVRKRIKDRRRATKAKGLQRNMNKKLDAIAASAAGGAALERSAFEARAVVPGIPAAAPRAGGSLWPERLLSAVTAPPRAAPRRWSKPHKREGD